MHLSTLLCWNECGSWPLSSGAAKLRRRWVYTSAAIFIFFVWRKPDRIVEPSSAEEWREKNTLEAMCEGLDEAVKDSKLILHFPGIGDNIVSFKLF